MIDRSEDMKNMIRGDFGSYGEKCERCWRRRMDVENLKVLGMLCNRCFLVMEGLFLEGKLDEFKQMNGLTDTDIRSEFPWLKRVQK